MSESKDAIKVRVSFVDPATLKREQKEHEFESMGSFFAWRDAVPSSSEMKVISVDTPPSLRW